MRGSGARVRTILFLLTTIPAVLTTHLAAQAQNPKHFPDRDTVSAEQVAVLTGLLDSSLASLAATERQGRMAGGYILLGLGAGSAIGGAVTLAVGEGDDARIVGYSLLGGSAVLAGLSLVPFRVRSESERLYASFRRELETLPAGLMDSRFYYWDRRFEELAQKSKQGRLIGGVTSIATAAVIGFVVVEGSGRQQLNTFLWPAAGGVISLIVKSEAERRYETYRRAKEDVLAQATLSRPMMRIGIAPLAEGGIAGTLLLQF